VDALVRVGGFQFAGGCRSCTWRSTAFWPVARLAPASAATLRTWTVDGKPSASALPAG